MGFQQGKKRREQQNLIRKWGYGGTGGGRAKPGPRRGLKRGEIKQRQTIATTPGVGHDPEAVESD